MLIMAPTGLYWHRCTTRFWACGTARLTGMAVSLIGDAVCFIEPTFPSGHQADEQAVFGEFERRYRRESGVYYSGRMPRLSSAGPGSVQLRYHRS